MNSDFYYDLKDVILIGDNLTWLKRLPPESINCVVSSPSYYGQRDYGRKGQIGLEPTPGLYLQRMEEVFGEVYRVLKPDGTLWLNLGDSYASAKSRYSYSGQNMGADMGNPVNGKKPDLYKYGYKDKDLIGIPWRVAFALQAAGWYLRNDIIWEKSNGLPESVEDRCTKSHEYVFLMTKSPNYYYDADAIREPHKQVSIERAARGRSGENKHAKGKSLPSGVTSNTLSNAQPARAYDSIEESVENGEIPQLHPKGRNKRTVWTIPTANSKVSHTAVMPARLAETCILAGCPEGGIVLDPFGGSGTTGAVAVSLNRHYLLIELNPAYVAEAQTRIRAACNANPFYDTELENGKKQLSLLKGLA